MPHYLFNNPVPAQVVDHRWMDAAVYFSGGLGIGCVVLVVGLWMWHRMAK